MKQALVFAALLAAAALAACDGADSERDAGSEGSGTSTDRGGAHEVSSKVGEEPSYFVPRQPGTPLATVGRARLAISGKPVELSASAGREPPIGPALCVNPAYRGRGELGIYIPSNCFATPLPEISVGRVQVPEQAVRGYELVIGGVTRGAGADVTARFRGVEADAAVFDVDGRLARDVGTRQEFSAFVVELPSEAACRSITLEARGPAGRASDRIAPKPKICGVGGRA